MTAANRGDLKPGLRLVHGPWSWSALLGTVGTSSGGEKGTRPHDGILIIKLLTAQICGNGGGINDRIRQRFGGKRNLQYEQEEALIRGNDIRYEGDEGGRMGGGRWREQKKGSV